MLSDDLPRTQLTASEDASEARAAEQAGDPASRRPATILLGADEPVWVLRFWDTGHEDLTVWAGDDAEDAAIAYLASYVRGNWSNLTDHRVVGEQSPASDRDAIRLFYGHPDKQAGQRGAEGYTLSAEPVRTAR